MCGILGYIGHCDKQKFTAALNTLAHRGPDGSGTWEGPASTLGHRRLSIIDMSDQASQPMELNDRYVITFNGEIYNYRELRKELLSAGVVFRSQSDTEVLLQAYIKWGAQCLEKLNGMWAFGIWDKQEQTLFLARDRMGKKPLFYSVIQGGFVFASEMKAIYRFLPRVEMNSPLVQAAISDPFCYESTEECLIQGIKRFPAASFGIYQADKGLAIQKFWDPLKNLTRVPSAYTEQVEMFRTLFFNACQVRMRSDVTIGTALSGGLDSSAVICSMAHVAGLHAAGIQNDWQHAFVATFPNTSVDETRYAQAVTSHLGIRADFVAIDPVNELNDIYRQAYQFEELYYAPTIPFVQLYRSIRQKGVIVSIDGHGADELFGGYPFDLVHAIPDALPNIARTLDVIRTINTSYPDRKKYQELVSYLKMGLVNKFPVLASALRKKEELNLLRRHPGLSFLDSQLYESAFVTILPTLLRNYDRYSMMNGVEIRMPFLDHRIVEFAFSIPYSSKVRKGYTKAIVRDALKDILPAEVSTRKTKIGFNSPMDAWMTGPLQEWIKDTVHSAEFAASSLIDPVSTRKEVLDALQKKVLSYSEGEKTFARLMPFIWEKSLNCIHAA